MRAVVEQIEIQIKYAGYIARQRAEVARHEHNEHPHPGGFRLRRVRGLSIEVREKLLAQRPETVGQASRISGVTPAAISLLLVHLKRLNRGGWRKARGLRPCSPRPLADGVAGLGVTLDAGSSITSALTPIC